MAKTARRVLIVDDNSTMRALLRTLLRGDEYDVVGEASNGEAAIEMAQRLTPDIVCLDIDMPKMGGLEVLGEIRKFLPRALVLMISGHAERDLVQQAIGLGAAGYIVKPFNGSKVFAAIAAALGSQSRKSP